MSNLILVRHGQSRWNYENRFTGWVDVDLTEQGKIEAIESGKLIKNLSINFNFCFTSLQKRAVNTLLLILEILDQKNLNYKKAWELNERNYGALTGLNKKETIKKYGEQKVHLWRRDWKLRPPPMNKDNANHPINNELYKNIKPEHILDSESLQDTYNRVIPFWEKNIKIPLSNNKNIIITAHGNSLRALYKKIFKINEKNISNLEIPTGNPLLVELNDELQIKKFNYLDLSRSKKIPN